MLTWCSKSFKVTDFSSNRKPVCDFLLVNTTYILFRTVSELARSIGQLLLLTGCDPL